MPERKHVTTIYSDEVANALQAIYRVYGPNLSAFFRDAKEAAASHGCESRIERQTAKTKRPKRAQSAR